MANTQVFTNEEPVLRVFENYKLAEQLMKVQTRNIGTNSLHDL